MMNTKFFVSVGLWMLIAPFVASSMEPETVVEAYNRHKKKYGRNQVFLKENGDPLLDAKFKKGFVSGGLGGSTCAFFAYYDWNYKAPGNWLQVNLDGCSFDIAPKAMFANTLKWPNIKDRSGSDQRARQILRVWSKGGGWKVNWAIQSGGDLYIKSYPNMAYDLKTPQLLSQDFSWRKLLANWDFEFGYPKDSSNRVNSSLMQYNVMHELYFDGKATSSSKGEGAVRIQIELAQSKNHGMSPIYTAYIGNTKWNIGYFWNSAARQHVWQFTRIKTNYYRKYGRLYYPPMECKTNLDIFDFLRWLKAHPTLAQYGGRSGNPTFPTSLTFKRVESGIEIINGLDGSCFKSNSYSMKEK